MAEGINTIFKIGNLNLAIVKSLQTSIARMSEICTDNDFKTRNGYGAFRWNPIITQLEKNCQHIGWLTGTCRRGSWNAPVLYESSSNYLITLMTEARLKDVQRKASNGTHYLCGAASFNTNIKNEYEQMTLDLYDASNDLQEKINHSRDQLAESVGVNVDNIKGHILVLFDISFDKLISVRAVRLTPDLHFSSEEEIWTSLIGKDYCAEQPIEPQTIKYIEEEQLVELI